MQTAIFLELARVLTVEHTRTRERLVAEGLPNVTPAMSRSLMLLFQAKRPLTASEVSRRLGVTEASMTRTVKSLVADGWVDRDRDPDDRRAFQLSLTAKARETFPQFVRVSNAMLDEIFADMPANEVETLLGIVERVRKNLSDV